MQITTIHAGIKQREFLFNYADLKRILKEYLSSHNHIGDGTISFDWWEDPEDILSPYIKIIVEYKTIESKETEEE